MKIAFIFVLYKTPQKEILRLKGEIKRLELSNYKVYLTDNTNNNVGYAAGVNQGIRKAIKDGCEIFVVANPDISLNDLRGHNWLDGIRYFDICGFAMRQEGKTYYGGELDKWRMSGGLIGKKPSSRFQETEFVSGSLMVIKKEVIERIGYFDESYFLYYEEVDFCYRAKKAGFKIGIDKDTIYEHFEVSKNSSSKNYYLLKNRLKFLLKYGSVKQKFYEFVRSPKTVYEEIIKRPFYLNFFSLNIASVINKILHFFLFIVLIRTFAPEEYAIYTLAWTHVGILLPFLDFGTTSWGLINLPYRKSENFTDLYSMRIALSVLTLVLTIILAFVFRYPLKIVIPIILTSVVVLANTFSGSYLIFTSVKEKSYLVSVISTVFQLVLISISIATVLLTRKLIHIFLIIFFFYGLYGLVNFFLIKREIKDLKFKMNFTRWYEIGKKSFVFLAISFLAGFYSKADVLLLNFLKGQRDVGIYSAGYKFLDAMMFMITAYNVSSIPMLSKFVRERKKYLFELKIKKDFVLVLILGGLVAFLISFFAPVILPVLMKGKYLLAIEVTRVIVFALPMILLTSVALNGLYALGQAKKVLLLFIFQTFFNLTMNYLLIPNYSYFASTWITLIGEILNVLLSFAILGSVLNKDRTFKERPS